MLPTERDPDSPNFLSMNGESGGNSRRNSSKITSTSSASSKIRQRSSSSDLRGSSVAAALDPIRERRVSLNSSTFGMGNARTDAIRDSILSYNTPSEREPHPFSAAAIREESFLSGSPASSPVMRRDPSHDEPTPLPSSHQMQRKLSELTYRMPSNSVSSHMTPVPIRTSLVESRAIAKEDAEMSPVASSSIRDIQQRYPSSHFHHSRLPAMLQGDMHTIETLHTPRPSSLSDDPFRRSPMMISEDSLVGGDREVISSNGHSRYSERDWRHSMNMDMEERDDVTDLVSTQGTSRRRKLHRKGHSQRNSASFGPEPNFSSPDFGKGHPGKGGSLSRLFHWRGNRDH
ncbi:hypothetical protein BT69DRAFT_602815 [Atractiella rhizophila]|nr:hypothetical protein BT69DRAFT_602815 [Atractiella rhizophila]